MEQDILVKQMVEAVENKFKEEKEARRKARNKRKAEKRKRRGKK